MNILGRAARGGAVTHLLAEFRRDRDPVPATLQNLPEHPLASARAAVDVGRVEERDPRVERGVDDGARTREVDSPAEVVAAEPDPRHAHAAVADLDEIHVENLAMHRAQSLWHVHRRAGRVVSMC